MKKIIVFVLALILCLGVMVSCKNSSRNPNNANSRASSSGDWETTRIPI